MKSLTIALFVSAISTGVAHAQHAGDVFLKVKNGAIITGRDEGGTPVFPARVFGSEFGKSIPGSTLEPGFEAEPGTFPPQTPVGVSIRKALRVWDGSDFDLIPQERLDLVKGVQTITTPVTDPPTCQVGGHLTLGLATPAGSIHQHAAFNLLPPQGDGVYLLELEAWMGAPGQGISAPFWIVFDQNAPIGMHDEALEYAEQILTCPADFNRDGALNLADFGAFQTGFAVGDPRADFNRDCALNLADFGAFQTAFALGCP